MGGGDGDSTEAGQVEGKKKDRKLKKYFIKLQPSVTFGRLQQIKPDINL